MNEITLKINELERKLEQMGERPNGRNRLPVSVIEIQPSTFRQYIIATSTVEAVQTAIISPETNGQISKIEVEKGQRVSGGQVVARLNTKVISSSMEEVKTSLSMARTIYQRQKGLWEQQIGSEIQYLQAKNSVETLETRLKTLESQMEMAVMRAPFEGMVDEIFLKTGELAMPGSRVMHMLNLRRLYINADVSETHLGNIRKGDQVILRFPAFPNHEMVVPVHRVGNVINPENRTFRVQLLIDNLSGQYKPNMMATMSLNTTTHPDVIVIPSILIRQDLQGHYVYVSDGNNGDIIASKRYIERGPDGEGRTMVLSGLKPGDLLINKGYNQVSDGTLLQIDSDT